MYLKCTIFSKEFKQYCTWLYKYLKNDVIEFTETQIKPSDSASITDDTLKDFDIDFDRNDYSLTF